MNTLRNILLVPVLALAGCGSAIVVDAPADFVELPEDRSHYDWRATTAHGVVVSAREIDNEVEGNLDFWLDAIKNKLRVLGGYALLEETEVTAASGETGRQLRFGRDERGNAYQYWVTLWVTPDHVLLVEAGGRQERFEEAQPRVEAAIASTVLR